MATKNRGGRPPMPTPPPSTTPAAFKKEFDKNSKANPDETTDTPKVKPSSEPLAIDGFPSDLTNDRFGEVFSGVYGGEDDKDSRAVENFQKFLNSELTNTQLTEIGGPLREDGWFDPCTWKAFQYWSYLHYIDLVHTYAPGWGLWAWVDGEGTERAWKVLQHLLNRAETGSNLLPRK